MKLRSFSVKGFKNFEEELRLEDLGDINVIHGATVDWLIAAQADCEGWLLVSEDSGHEFFDVRRRVRLAELEGALGGLVHGNTSF